MTDQLEQEKRPLVDQLAAEGYWVALAAKYLEEGKYSGAVRLCKEHLSEKPDLISGRLIYATALYRAGQTESAAEQFHHVLSLDPDNLVALKYLGDIKFITGDELAAMANYRRILEIDPCCRGLKSEVSERPKATTRKITLTRGVESRPERISSRLRDIPFYTETMGDLYLAQGYSRLAVAVYRRLVERNQNPRLAEKLANLEEKIREKEH